MATKKSTAKKKIILTFNTIAKHGYPKKNGRFLVKGPTSDPKIPFLGIGYYLLPEGEDEGGFWVYPEEFIMHIEEWADLKGV